MRRGFYGTLPKGTLALIRDRAWPIATPDLSAREIAARAYVQGLKDAGDTISDATATPTPAASDGLREAGAFLVERLQEFEHVVDSETAHREYYGHVAPALARFRQALSTASTEEG